MDLESLPEIVQRFARKYPDVWNSYNRLGETAAKAGPLDASAERLVKLALAVGGRREGAVRSHARRGLAHGLTPQQLEHVAVLAITTIGWPAALAALSWIDEEIDHVSQADRPSA